MAGCGGLLRDAAAAQWACSVANEPGSLSGGAPRGASGRRAGLERLPGQRSSSERQGVRAHGTGHGFRGPGHADRVPAAHRRRCRRRRHPSRRSRLGRLRHGADRFLRPRGGTAVFRARKVLSTTSVFSLVLAAVFGVAFAGSVQGGFERVWGLPAGPWHKIWRQAVWLIVFIAYIYAAATVGVATRHTPVQTVSRVLVAIVLGLVFFCWGLRFLVGGRVSYLAAMPGAVATLAFLAGLRVFSSLVFEPLVVTNAVTYGALGTVLVVQSWLIGVGWVVYGGQLFGRWFHDAWLRSWADNRRGRPVPGDRANEP